MQRLLKKAFVKVGFVIRVSDLALKVETFFASSLGWDVKFSLPQISRLSKPDKSARSRHCRRDQTLSSSPAKARSTSFW